MGRWDLRPMAAPRGNQAIAGRNGFTWASFERLPRVVRDVINFAPVELGSFRAEEALAAGMSAEAVARQEIAMARAFVRQQVLLTYGPDHPQAPETASAA